MFAKNEKKGEVERPSGLNQIDHGTKITGDIESQGNFRIDGEVIGNIYSKSKIFLGKSGKVTGNIKAVNAEVEGKINGNVEISELLVLKDTAVVNGDITSAKINIVPGAVYNGHVSMGATAAKGNSHDLKAQPRPAIGKTA